MERIDNYKRAFYVVQFIDLPFEGIADYVCVPKNWVVLRFVMNQKAAIAYPKDEDPFVTRDRVKKKEKLNDKWRYYMAAVKYETDSYGDAENWIATRKHYGPLVEQELKTTDSEPKSPLNKKLRVANPNHSSQLNNNPQKPLPGITIKRPALPETSKLLNGKRMKLGDAAQSSSAVVSDAGTERGSSKHEQWIIAQDNHLMESDQTGTTASDSNGTLSSSQRKYENLQESSPIEEQQEFSIPYIDVATPDTPALVIDDDKEAQPTGIVEQQGQSQPSQQDSQGQPQKPKISICSTKLINNRQAPTYLPKKKRKLWRFVLPSEYDPYDTKWTLEYRTNLPGLVELMPQSGVYVSPGELEHCQRVSKDCKSLALRLLSAVFNRKALSVCLSMTERAQASDNVRSNARPELDEHACSVLLNSVLEHGLQRGWNTDLQPIFHTLHSKIQEIRFKYGVMVEC